MCQTAEPVKPVTTSTPNAAAARAVSYAFRIAVTPHLGRQDPLVAHVDRVAHALPHEMRADRPAAEAVPLEQGALLVHVAAVGDGPVDREVVAPARELGAAEPPRRELPVELVERQVRPLAGEQRDGSSHRSLLGDC